MGGTAHEQLPGRIKKSVLPLPAAHLAPPLALFWLFSATVRPICCVGFTRPGEAADLGEDGLGEVETANFVVYVAALKRPLGDSGVGDWDLSRDRSLLMGWLASNQDEG